jgi:RNA polymerase sigma-70 factor, ECF subfamily
MGSTAVHASMDRGRGAVVDAGRGREAAIDAELVHRIRHGSEAALGQVYDRHAEAVFASAMQTSRDRWIAEEVVQETFLALWDRADRFDEDRGALRAWLMTVARNRAIDRLRAAGRHDRAASFTTFAAKEVGDASIDEWLAATGALIGIGAADPLPEVALADKETRAAIGAAIADLDPVEQRVIVLAYDKGLTQSEIADSLGWPIGTVKTRTRRALRHLREELGPMPLGMPGPASAPCPAPCP